MKTKFSTRGLLLPLAVFGVLGPVATFGAADGRNGKTVNIGGVTHIFGEPDGTLRVVKTGRGGPQTVIIEDYFSTAGESGTIPGEHGGKGGDGAKLTFSGDEVWISGTFFLYGSEGGNGMDGSEHYEAGGNGGAGGKGGSLTVTAGTLIYSNVTVDVSGGKGGRAAYGSVGSWLWTEDECPEPGDDAPVMDHESASPGGDGGAGGDAGAVVLVSRQFISSATVAGPPIPVRVPISVIAAGGDGGHGGHGGFHEVYYECDFALALCEVFSLTLYNAGEGGDGGDGGAGGTVLYYVCSGGVRPALRSPVFAVTDSGGGDGGDGGHGGFCFLGGDVPNTVVPGIAGKGGDAGHGGDTTATVSHGTISEGSEWDSPGAPGVRGLGGLYWQGGSGGSGSFPCFGPAWDTPNVGQANHGMPGNPGSQLDITTPNRDCPPVTTTPTPIPLD